MTDRIRPSGHRFITSLVATLGTLLAIFTLVGPDLGPAPAQAAVTPCPTPVVSASTATVTCSYTGGGQTWTVPAGVTSATFDVQAAQGGSAQSNLGGLGGRAIATLAVTAGTTMTIMVGGAGANGAVV